MAKNQPPKHNTPDPYQFAVKMALSVYVFALIAIGFYAWNFRKQGLSDEAESWGQFGDFMGGVINPFVGIVTVLLVVINIRLQREELRASLAELKRSNESAAVQSFEQSLFSWLGNYHALVESISYHEYRGRAALDHMYGDGFRLDLPPYFSKATFASVEERKTELELAVISAIDSYDKVFEQYRSSLDAPLRTLFRLFQWIDEQEFDLEKKWHYAALVRAQLSWPELVHLFFNGLRNRGRKFALLCNKYAVLDNLLVGRDDLVQEAAYQIAKAELDPAWRMDALPNLTSSAFASELAKKALGIGPAQSS